VSLGNSELTRLWNLTIGENEIESLVDRVRSPVLEEFLKLDEIDRFSEIKQNKVYSWRALRLIARQKLSYFSGLQNGSLEDVVALMEKEKKGDAPITNDNVL